MSAKLLGVPITGRKYRAPLGVKQVVEARLDGTGFALLVPTGQLCLHHVALQVEQTRVQAGQGPRQPTAFDDEEVAKRLLGPATA